MQSAARSTIFNEVALTSETQNAFLEMVLNFVNQLL